VIFEGDETEAVKVWQELLILAGRWDPGPIDGLYGRKTSAATARCADHLGVDDTDEGRIVSPMLVLAVLSRSVRAAELSSRLAALARKV